MSAHMIIHMQVLHRQFGIEVVLLYMYYTHSKHQLTVSHTMH